MNSIYLRRKEYDKLVKNEMLFAIIASILLFIISIILGSINYASVYGNAELLNKQTGEAPLSLFKHVRINDFTLIARVDDEKSSSSYNVVMYYQNDEVRYILCKNDSLSNGLNSVDGYIVYLSDELKEKVESDILGEQSRQGKISEWVVVKTEIWQICFITAVVSILIACLLFVYFMEKQNIK